MDMRLTLCLLLLDVGLGAAQDRPTFYLEDGRVVQRLDATDARVAKLEAEVKALKAANCPCNTPTELVAFAQATASAPVLSATAVRAELGRAGVSPLVITDVLKLIVDLRNKAPRETVLADVIAIIGHLSAQDVPTLGAAPAETTSGQCYIDPATGATVCPSGSGSRFGWFGLGVVGPGTGRGLFRR